MKVEVVPYRDEWVEMFLAEAEQIKKILTNNLVTIFHIGSTSVQGLMVKPIIDIMPVVCDITLLDSCSAAFEAGGYEVMGEFGIKGRRYYRKGGDNRTHQIHAFQYDNIFEIDRHLTFRNYLREHPAAKDEYGTLKYRLAQQFPSDIDEYCTGKESFVSRLEKEALKWHWKKQ